jgi:hypothetical protein
VIIFNPSEPISISASALTHYLHKHLIEQSYGFPDATVILPESSEIAEACPLSELTTDWESPLLGTRIADFRGTGLRVLERDKNGKVERSRKMDREATADLYQSFLEQIRNDFRRISFAESLAITYPLPEVVSLLKASFQSPEPPRLVPQLSWPSREECEAMIRKIVSIPWVWSSVVESRTLKLQNGVYRYVLQGERGEVELEKTSASEDEILWEIFKEVVSYDYLNNPRCFQFSSFSAYG